MCITFSRLQNKVVRANIDGLSNFVAFGEFVITLPLKAESANFYKPELLRKVKKTSYQLFHQPQYLYLMEHLG